ncbi:TPA: hypothetical protein ACGPI4_004159 [Bacillus paranthracis]
MRQILSPLVDFAKELLEQGTSIEELQRELSKELHTYNDVNYVISLARDGFVEVDDSGRVINQRDNYLFYSENLNSRQ